MRIVVVSDRPLSTEALVSALAHIPGASVVAKVSGLGPASLFCENGKADVVIADAAVVHGMTLGLAFPVSGPAAPRAGRAAGGPLTAEAVAGGQRPWQLPPTWLADLTSREYEVFVLLGMGLSNQRIAHQLAIKEQTVKSHVGRILAKLHLESRLQAGLTALAHLAEHAADPSQP